MRSPCRPTAAANRPAGSPPGLAVDNQDGFEGFELLKPTDERTTWQVVTR